MPHSMIERRPKIHDTKSFKFYPEECHRRVVSFRHKNLSPDFDLSLENTAVHHAKNSMKPQTSSFDGATCRKCPIYVHNFGSVKPTPDKSHHHPPPLHHPHQTTAGDFITKQSSKTLKNKKSLVEKLEESYWANWKPQSATSTTVEGGKINKKSPEIQVIKSAPERRRKFKVFPHANEAIKVEARPVKTQIEKAREEEKRVDEASSPEIVKISTKTQEIQTEINTTATNVCEANLDAIEESESKILKHTDSFILNVKKHKATDKDSVVEEQFEQPKCIRLYRKPGKLTSKNFIKGGSYPLKSCLKKDSMFAKGNIRLGRPGSPIIVSSNYSGAKHYGKNHRR